MTMANKISWRWPARILHGSEHDKIPYKIIKRVNGIIGHGEHYQKEKI